MAFEFLHDIHESRMTRSGRNQRMLTYTDCRERAFLILLILFFVKNLNSKNLNFLERSAF